MENYAFVVVLAIVLNLLLLPTYFSTDFEVHRNWMAITHSLPIQEWYTDTTSAWTLDYPPLFAWFEYFLGYCGKLVDPQMLNVTNLDYASKATIAFQRISVIMTDFVYYIAVAKLWLFWSSRVGKIGSTMSMWFELSFGFLFVFNFHLLLVDHIHFQYNGFLTGIFLFSVAAILQDQPLRSALWFSILLNMKHIYLYVAPVYFIYLLRYYCLQNFSSTHWPFGECLLRLISLGSIVISIFGLSFGPFIYYGQLGQVLSRLFPFQRGLCHAYWAPNVWALYNVADKFLQRLLHIPSLEHSSMTGGLVREYQYVVLPNITPSVTLGLCVVSMMPILIHLWTTKRSSKRTFLSAVVLCSWCSYLFGWHVHEKAIILIIIPLLLLASFDRRYCEIALLVNLFGGYSLFPLIFTQQETGIKVVLFLFTNVVSWRSLHILHLHSQQGSLNAKRSDDDSNRNASWRDSLGHYLKQGTYLYIATLLPLMIYNGFLHKWLYGDQLPFLPLLLTSLYCAFPMILTFLYCLFRTVPFLSISIPKKIKTN